jgi:hypothetical protein
MDAGLFGCGGNLLIFATYKKAYGTRGYEAIIQLWWIVFISHWTMEEVLLRMIEGEYPVEFFFFKMDLKISEKKRYMREGRV